MASLCGGSLVGFLRFAGGLDKQRGTDAGKS